MPQTPASRTHNLLAALKAAKARKMKPIPISRALDIPPGMRTNEAGPQVETNYPPNAWPSDGDHD